MKLLTVILGLPIELAVECDLWTRLVLSVTLLIDASITFESFLSEAGPVDARDTVEDLRRDFRFALESGCVRVAVPS